MIDDWETERSEAGYDGDWDGSYSNYCQWCREEIHMVLPDGGSDYITSCPNCGHTFFEYEGDLGSWSGSVR